MQAELFRPLTGMLTWNCRRDHGSFLSLQFGAPHLSVREPITPSPGISARAAKLLARRRVSMHGDWCLLVLHCDWLLEIDGKEFHSNLDDLSVVDEYMAYLDGQRLVSAELIESGKAVTMKFDLGASLKLEPSADGDATDDDEQWAVYRADAIIAL
jgi:hypothetical protein